LSKILVVAVFALRKPVPRAAAQRFNQTGRFTASVSPATARAEFSQCESSHHTGERFAAPGPTSEQIGATGV